MKLLRKIAIWFGGFVAAGVLAFIALGIYVNYIDVCDPYQTNFLGKAIKFPMRLNEATQHYHIQTNDIISWSFSEGDTLLIVDTKYGSSKKIDKVIFYLRDLSSDDIRRMQLSLEKQYGHKFIVDPVFPGILYLKITDCVYIQFSIRSFREDALASFFVKSPPKGSHKREITCTVSFWYHVSEGEVSGWSNEGGFDYIVAPVHLPHRNYLPSLKKGA